MHRDERIRKEAEEERYELVVNNGVKLPNKSKDDGRPAVKGRHKKPKIASNRGALTANLLLVNKEDRNIYAFHYNSFKEEILERKGSLSFTDNFLLITLCTSVVRLYRKTKLESEFGRFMDRVATQDPIVQINNCLKSLGLLSDKKDSDDDMQKRITQILTQTVNIDDGGETTIKQVDGFTTWKRARELEVDEIKPTKFQQKERMSYGDEFDAEES